MVEAPFDLELPVAVASPCPVVFTKVLPPSDLEEEVEPLLVAEVLLEFPELAEARALPLVLVTVFPPEELEEAEEEEEENLLPMEESKGLKGGGPCPVEEVAEVEPPPALASAWA